MTRSPRHNVKPQSKFFSCLLEHQPTKRDHPSAKDARENKNLEQTPIAYKIGVCSRATGFFVAIPRQVAYSAAKVQGAVRQNFHNEHSRHLVFRTIQIYDRQTQPIRTVRHYHCVYSRLHISRFINH